MNGLMKVIDMLGMTIADLQAENDRLNGQVEWLQKALGDKPADDDGPKLEAVTYEMSGQRTVVGGSDGSVE